jgi:hypothetical protein
MWVVLTLVIGGVLVFFWLALCLTIAAWGYALGNLLQGNFIRAAIWGSVGFGMLAWWNGTETIPHPWDVDAWLRASAWIVGFGALLTFIRFYHRHRHQQAAQTDTPSLNINVHLNPGWDIGDCEVRERRSPGENFVAVDRIGRHPSTRRNIGAKQSPRRIAGPTIIDQ